MKLSTFGLLHRSFTEQQFSWITRILFISSLILIIGLSYSYHSINGELINYTEKVSQTRNIITANQNVSTAIYKTTYLSDSYLLLGDTAYYNKTLAGAQEAARHLLQLDSLLKNDASQRIHTREAQKHLFRFRELIGETRNVLHRRAQQTAIQALHGLKATEVDEIQRHLAAIGKSQKSLLASRAQSRDNYMLQTFNYNWITMIVAIVFLTSAFFLLDRELKRNKLYRVDLENKVENLNRSNAELEQFAYIASHDLQEPLRKIRSFADRIMSKYAPVVSPDLLELLRKIEGSSARMQTLINDLLAFSRVVNTGSQLRITNLNATMAEVKFNLSEAIIESEGKIEHGPLPSIEAFGTQMVQLFQNLISNSLKYRREGVAPVVMISHALVMGDAVPGIKPAHSDVEFHKITVSDNGIGFKAEFAEKIFVIFQRLHDRTQFEGTGIGLAICKRIVSNHNGYIFAEGNIGHGAIFSIYLPTQSLLREP